MVVEMVLVPFGGATGSWRRNVYLKNLTQTALTIRSVVSTVSPIMSPYRQKGVLLKPLILSALLFIYLFTLLESPSITDFDLHCKNREAADV